MKNPIKSFLAKRRANKAMNTKFNKMWDASHRSAPDIEALERAHRTDVLFSVGERRRLGSKVYDPKIRGKAIERFLKLQADAKK